jgi:hypothetical protein
MLRLFLQFQYINRTLHQVAYKRLIVRYAAHMAAGGITNHSITIHETTRLLQPKDIGDKLAA